MSSTVGIEKFLDGQGRALFCHLLVLGVKSQAYNSFRADLDVHHSLPCGLVPEQSGCHHSHPHDLIGVKGLLSWDASDDWWWAAFHRLFLPQHLVNDLLSWDASDDWWWAAFHRLLLPQLLGNLHEPW